MNVIERAIDWAIHFQGTVEVPKNSNRGVIIDDIQKSFGFIGVSYCALFVLYCYKRACAFAGRKYPFPDGSDRNYSPASSQSLFQWAIKNGYAETDFSKLNIGDIVIWRKMKLWQGHVGLVTSVDQEHKTFMTMEGNTSNSDFGDQREGGGIYQRLRYMRQTDFVVDAFYLRGFISVRKVFPNEDTNKIV